MKVFLTGATGLLGRHVLMALRERGDSVLALSRSAAADESLRAAGAEPLRGDLADGAALSRGSAETDATVHAAAIIIARGDWAAYHAANVAPTEAIARGCAQQHRRLVHISSVSVYGRATTYDGGKGSVSESFGLDRPLVPRDHYARSKREAERALWRIAQSSGLAAVALRPCVLYGEGDRTFSNRVARLLRRRLAPVIGGGANDLSVVYAGNVAAAVLAALDRPTVTGPFNVANDGGISLRDFVRHFAAGLEVRPLFVPVPRALARHGARAVDAVARAVRPGQSITLLRTAVQFLASDNPYSSAGAERELGWRPVVAPADAAERTGRWFRAHS